MSEREESARVRVRRLRPVQPGRGEGRLKELFTPTPIYPVTDHDFDKLASAGHSLWRDLSLAFGPLSIALCLNAVSDIYNQDQFQITLPVFLNALLGSVFLLGAVVFLCLWLRNHTSVPKVIRDIKTDGRLVYPRSSLPSPDE